MPKELRHGLDEQLVANREADDVGASKVVGYALSLVLVLAEQIAACRRPLSGGTLQDVSGLFARREPSRLDLHLLLQALYVMHQAGHKVVLFEL